MWNRQSSSTDGPAMRFFSLLLLCAWVVSPPSAIQAQVFEPLPYAPIANPLPDTTDQLQRDSATIDIGRIRVNQAGYRPQDAKFVYYIGAANPGHFRVLDAVSGSQVATGSFQATSYTTSGQISIKASNNATRVPNGDTRYTMKSAVIAGSVFEGRLPENLATGRYVIEAAGERSADFIVDQRVYGMVRDALLKFFGIQRSGNSASWFHGPSHLQDVIPGGWYDCGDHLKESLTQSYALSMLGLVAAAMPEKDGDNYGRSHAQTVQTDGIPDVLYEAVHGARYVMASYDHAGGKVADMITAVGDFGTDHQWWGRPELQDKMPADRGGPPRPGRNEVGANVVGRFAAGMAFVSKMYRPYDAPFADKALEIAKKLYAFGKTTKEVTGTPAYSGESSLYDDMGLAAIALMWATEEASYKYDLLENTSIGDKGNPAFPKGTFAGGWFAYDNPSPQHGLANTSWASIESPALWALYKLILRDRQKSQALGIDEAQRLALIEDVIFALIANIGNVGAGDKNLPLPQGSMGWKSHDLKYDGLWHKMHVIQEWVWNRYQAGNSAELFFYYDIAREIQGLALPNTPGSEDWKSGEVKQILIRQLDYMLGINPWDVSMIYGIGNKNFNHPHHRAANPEGKNVPGSFYRYRPPVGALQGSFDPQSGLYEENWADYKHSEVCLDGTTTLLLPVMGMANELDVNAKPEIEVAIEHVGHNEAIVQVRQSRYGRAEIVYGLTETKQDKRVSSDSAGSVHRIVLRDLKPGTTYHFYAEAQTVTGAKAVKDNNGSLYRFTTATQPSGPAQIENVAVCNITHDSAHVLWYTPNGAYGSKVKWDTEPRSYSQMRYSKEGDISGIPARFHEVHIGVLQEKTTYYYGVESNGQVIEKDVDGKPLQFTTPVEHVEFDVRTLEYNWGGMPTMGINVINQDSKGYDSLELRVYMRGTEEEMADFGARVDIGIKYNSAGYQDKHFKGVVDGPLQAQKPIKIADTYNASDNTYAWYFRIPFGDAEMEPGARFRLDIILVKRNLPFNDDLLNEPPTHIPGSGDWSWSPHSRAESAPLDYPGMPQSSKETVDNDIWNTPINPYVTVYRKNEFVWGFSPSRKEQEQKRAHYDIALQLEPPFDTPDGGRIDIAQTSSIARIKGVARITEAGHVTDIWVNGARVEDLASAAKYDLSQDHWKLDIPIKLLSDNNGDQNVDLVVFAGSDPECKSCNTGACAFAKRSWIVHFEKAGAFPSTMVLQDPLGTTLDRTRPFAGGEFRIELGDSMGAEVNSLEVMVFNDNQGDTTRVQLQRLGDSRRFSGSLEALDLPPVETSAGQIAFAGGDSLWIQYEDPTDEEDTQRQYLQRPADFAQGRSGRIEDNNGDGLVDRLVIQLTKEPSSPTDSLRLTLPGQESIVLTREKGQSTVQGDVATWVPSTPWRPVSSMLPGGSEGQLYLTHQGKVRQSRFPLEDALPPYLKSADIRYDDTRKNGDTLYLEFSEPIPGTDSPDLQAIGIQGSGVNPSVSRVLAGDDESWIVLLTTAEEIALYPGDSLRLKPGTLADGADNGVGEDNPYVALTGDAPQEPLPVLVSGSYFDWNGDGNLDRVSLIFEDSVDIGRLKVTVSWPDPGLESEATVFTYGADVTEAIMDLNDVFGKRLPEGVTGGALQAASGGTAIELADKAAPILISARAVLSEIAGEGDSRLEVRFSESLDPDSWGDGSLLVLRRGSSEDGPMETARREGASADWILTIADGGSDGYKSIFPGDSLRIVPGSLSDGSGNAAHDHNPRVLVQGDDRPAVLRARWLDGPFYVEREEAMRPGFLLTLDQGGTWLPFEGGETGPALPCGEQNCNIPPENWTGPILELSTDRPFGYSVAVFTNLGAPVAGLQGTISRAELDQVGASGRYTLRLNWSGSLAGGQTVRTGAYVSRILLTATTVRDGQEVPIKVDETKIIGVVSRD